MISKCDVEFKPNTLKQIHHKLFSLFNIFYYIHIQNIIKVTLLISYIV